MKQWITKRGLPLLISLAIFTGYEAPVCGLFGAYRAEAAGFPMEADLDESCGYAEEKKGGHVHTEDCYEIIEECVHTHTEECYPEITEEEEEVWDEDATPSNGAKRKPENCPHICDEYSGCITKELKCGYENSREFEEEEGGTYDYNVCPNQDWIDILPGDPDIDRDNEEETGELLEEIDKADKTFMEILPVRAEYSNERLSHIVSFQDITLHYADSNGQPVGDPIQDNALIEKDKQLALAYSYEITEKQCEDIRANIPYYLEVSPHLVLPDLEKGSPLTIETDDGTEPFGMIYADGSRAWVVFDEKTDSSGTVLSDYGELDNAYFYLNCRRAADVPPQESPIDGTNNLYAMKFENNTQLNFGYAENEPVEAEAQIKKNGELADKIITWSIDYTPWQNPSPGDGITMDTPMELWDTIDTALHTYVENSAKINGVAVPAYGSRDHIPDLSDAYVIAQASDDGKGTVLIFGGTRFGAGKATQGNPPQPLKITYQTSVNDDLLLPGGSGGKRIANAAELFAGKGDAFSTVNIRGENTVTVPQPEWITKKGKTTRHTDGTGSTTDWTVTFNPNGFSFETANALTLHDQLPAGSTLTEAFVKAGDQNLPVTMDEKNGFTVSPIQVSGDPVNITYQTHVHEDMYNSGTSLGENAAWFTFEYGGEKYTTSVAKTPVGSGDGSGTPGTAPLVKTSSKYDSSTRTITWTVTINPHKAYLKKGTFTDDLNDTGGSCSINGHTGGLKLPNGPEDITVLVDNKEPEEAEKKLVTLSLEKGIITAEVGEIGAKTVTLSYPTKVCDPCIFANNTKGVVFTNKISTKNMVIGNSDTERSTSAESKADVSATVLVKKAPVYDYGTGKMMWTVE